MTTHSGQGDEPREGIVLPSNGEPWFPGRQEAAPVSPPAGRPWDEPWGPGADESPSTGAAAPLPPHAPTQGPSHPPPMPAMPPPQPPAPPSGPLPAYAPPGGPPPADTRYGDTPSGGDETQLLPPQPAGPAHGRPDAGGENGPSGGAQVGGPTGRFGAAGHGHGPYGQESGPGEYGQGQYGQGEFGQYPQTGQAPQPGQDQQAGQYRTGEYGRARHGRPPAEQPGPQHAAPQQYGGSAYGTGEYGQDSYARTGPAQSARQPQDQALHQPQEPGQAQDQSADGYATQPQGQFGPPSVMPPAGADAEATQFLPPQTAPGGPDADATQFIPPFADAPGGASGTEAGRSPLPPEAPTGQRPAAPMRGAAPERPSEPDFGVRAGTPGERPPPAEFDNLFRPEPAASGADSTQQLPQIGEAASRPRPAAAEAPARKAGPSRGRRGAEPEGRGRALPGRRKPSPMVMGAVGVVAIVLAGLIVGAALGGGDDSEDTTPAGQKGEPSAPAEDEQSEPPADPVEAQAKSLDSLLADSNNSREAVIRSVENIRKCEDLDTAAKDLRDAAKQRNELVTRLGELDIDQLPGHQKLASELTKAWKASASADDHYAAWADQVAGPRGCPDGAARSTGRQAKGNRASGDATAAKQKAAALWNPTARKYGLDERQPTEL